MGTGAPCQRMRANGEDAPRWRRLARRALFNGPELRPGWRLGLFVSLVAALSEARLVLVRRLLVGADRAVTYLVGGVLKFLILILCSWIIGRIEHRTLADFGLPWRRMFRARFWQGALLGIGLIGARVVTLWLVGVLRFGAPALRGPQIALSLLRARMAASQGDAGGPAGPFANSPERLHAAAYNTRMARTPVRGRDAAR